VTPEPANAKLIKSWTVDYWKALHPYSAGGAYVSFMMDEGQERVQATYVGTTSVWLRSSAGTTQPTSFTSTEHPPSFLSERSRMRAAVRVFSVQEPGVVSDRRARAVTRGLRRCWQPDTCPPVGRTH
jgi:hypothetical protein